MTLREATGSDCSLLAEMNHQLIQDERHRNPMTVAELAERMRGWLASGVYRAFLFEEDSFTLAYALFRTEPDSSIYLRQLFVSREHRRQGVGLQAVELLFREVFPSAPRVTVEVLADNEIGRAFWASVGFRSYSICLERFNDNIRIPD